MIRTSNEIALAPGFADGFLETTRAYFEDDASSPGSKVRASLGKESAPLPVIERGSGPRQMLHLLGPDST